MARTSSLSAVGLPGPTDYRSYWGAFYEADELELFDRTVRNEWLCADPFMLALRHYHVDPSAPTVVLAHGLLGYGVPFARFHLPFVRAGFNVTQFDLPGMGHSSGRRGGTTTSDCIGAWRAVFTALVARSDQPVFAAANAEDGVLAYYALANEPRLSALSVHTLFEYGDPRGAGWLHPAPVFRVTRSAIGMISRIRPTASVPAQWTIPWKHVFAGDDAEFRRLLAADPLALRRGEAQLGIGLLRSLPPPVPFEKCETPVQIIISEASRIWLPEVCRETYGRLAGSKDLVELPGAPHWEMNRAFHDRYCAHAIAWFRRWV